MPQYKEFTVYDAIKVSYGQKNYNTVNFRARRFSCFPRILRHFKPSHLDEIYKLQFTEKEYAPWRNKQDVCMHACALGKIRNGCNNGGCAGKIVATFPYFW
jgi:hypothetical protein